MEALKINAADLNKNRTQAVYQFSKSNFTIGDFAFKRNPEGKLYIYSDERFGKGEGYPVRNTMQLIFKLSTLNAGTGECDVCIGEKDDDEVVLTLKWSINDQPTLISEEQSEEQNDEGDE